MRYSEFDAAEKYEKFHDELHRNEDIALAALVGTLQWMVVNRRYELDFAYALRKAERTEQNAT